MKKIFLSLVLLNLLTACASSAPPEPETAPAKAPTNETPAAVPTPAPAAAAAEQPQTGQATAPEVKEQTLANTESENKAKAEAEAKAQAAATAKAEADEIAKAATAAAVTTQAAEAETQAAAVVEKTKRSVYFAFDVDTLRDEDKSIIQEQGEFLSAHPEIKVRSEGNADERGSSEYNLALGQRRANNTKKVLILSGAQAGQIEAISFGEEKPIAIGHNESAWSKNRRADIIQQ
ncbi:MAG: peptidoglycan-associated lipoprotein Pal [Gallionellaceae bacterium]|jgi:peptidoglycan-associated lipoprotein